MTTHITVRMAWHDNKWNGKICANPEENIYCSGNHSLLSSRIEKNKDVEIEKKNASKKLNEIGNYLPPCFWSINAFSTETYRIKHEHPFEDVNVKPIKEKLNSYSVFTWPFRLSFNHSEDKKKKDGTYPKPRELDRRIDSFFSELEPGKSIVFFYLNYDNPISADRKKYVLVGCSLLSNVGKKTYYNFTKEELARIRNQSKKMKNFPTLNWAVQLTHDFENWGILLPYHEYLEYIKEHPEEEELLEEMSVLIEEESIIPSFKYVAAHIDEDKALYLLYKLKKALQIIDDHGIFDVTREMERIEKLIEMSWQRRGLFPSLGYILDIINEEYESRGSDSTGNQLVFKLREKYKNDPQLIDFVFDLITEKNYKVPDYLEKFTGYIEDLQRNIDFLRNKIILLKKLSLFTLTKYQLKKIISQPDKAFKKKISYKEIIENPYILAEEYVPDEMDLDEEFIEDDYIDLSKIDIGMIPDKYLKRHKELQNLVQRSPERLRAIIIDYLKMMGQNGDCYVNVDDIYEYIQDYPIFYKEELHIDKDALADKNGIYYRHFSKRFTIIEHQNKKFFYLNEVYQAEQIIKNVIIQLLSRPDYDVELEGFDEYIQTEIDELTRDIKNFNKELFEKERRRLFNNVLKKSIFIISGKPGTGKTFVLDKIVSELKNQGETVTLLAPTGKATLRLRKAVSASSNDNTMTIDMFLYKNGYGDFLEDFENILLENPKKIEIENLIIDETSMVDLQRMAILFSIVNLKGPNRIKRIILVGDERQLPPIGFGKPFIDIIDYIKSEKKFENNYIRLRTNCRQEFDDTILKLADIFGEKTKYYEAMIEKLSKPGKISSGLTVALWSNRDELVKQVDRHLKKIIKCTQDKCNKVKKFNELLGLYDNGFVKKSSPETLHLDNLQILTPYRAGYFGTLGLNDFIKSEYREPHWADKFFYNSVFNHGDKIICVSNEYKYDYHLRKKTLRLSNGSIGIVNTKKKPKLHRVFYFMDQDKPIYDINEENFELAYAITVHKSQGSDFKDVFVVIPQKQALLSRELMYTALTRAKNKVVILLQKTEKVNLFEIARNRSAVLTRNTSIFTKPLDYKRIYEPEKGVFVRSKIEYILYKALEASGLDFEYEKELQIKGKSYVIHPDFTIRANGKTYYWEHLGELDIKDYFNDWQKRKDGYMQSGYYGTLITTDDLNGVRTDLVNKVIQDIMEDKLKISRDEDMRFSNHHYRLYND